jgi:PPP family 3-phenylpropionic acid transporter
VLSRASALRVYYFASFTAFGAYIPYFPAWLEARGMTGLSMSTITALLPFVGLVSPVAFGLASDALGVRGSLLRFASLGALVPFAVLTLSAAASVDLGYWSLFALVGTFAFFRAPMVLLADVTALEERSSYGRARLWGSAGFLAMAIAGGFFIDVKNRGALPTAIALGLGASVLAARELDEARARPAEPVLEDAARLLRSADFLVFLLSAFLWYAASVAYDLCFSLHLRDLGLPRRYVGLYWALGVVAEIALMHRSADLLARFTPARLIAFGLFVAAVRWTLMGTVSSLSVLFLLQPLHAVTFGLMWVASLAFVKERAPARVLATAQSLFTVATGMGSGTGMLVWGPLYARGGGHAVFTSAGAIALLGTAAAYVLGVVTPREGAANAE